MIERSQTLYPEHSPIQSHLEIKHWKSFLKYCIEISSLCVHWLLNIAYSQRIDCKLSIVICLSLMTLAANYKEITPSVSLVFTFLFLFIEKHGKRKETACWV